MRSVLLLIVLFKISATAVGSAQHWPHWRGPSHDGVSLEKGLPETWSATCAGSGDADLRDGDGGPSDLRQGYGGPAGGPSMEIQRGGQRPAGTNFEGRPLVPTVCANIETKGIAWKLPLPAYSGSTPIIWGNTIFLNVATGTNTGIVELWSIDRNKQAVNWKRQVTGANHMERKQNMSSPSPVTDGQLVWVMTGLGVF